MEEILVFQAFDHNCLIDLIEQESKNGLTDICSNNMFAKRIFFTSEKLGEYILNRINLFGTNFEKVMPNMRIINYEIGGFIAPHRDGYQIDTNGKSSTHSFLIYLNDCVEDGATEFLEDLTNEKVIKTIMPKKGNILIFPHNLPHRGQCVIDKKIILRGDLY